MTKFDDNSIAQTWMMMMMVMINILLYVILLRIGAALGTERRWVQSGAGCRASESSLDMTYMMHRKDHHTNKPVYICLCMSVGRSSDEQVG